MWDAILNKVVREGLPEEVMLLQRPAGKEAESPRDRISVESDPGSGNKVSLSTRLWSWSMPGVFQKEQGGLQCGVVGAQPGAE